MRRWEVERLRAIAHDLAVHVEYCLKVGNWHRRSEIREVMERAERAGLMRDEDLASPPPKRLKRPKSKRKGKA